MVTSQFICTAREIASGAAYTLRMPGRVPPATYAHLRLRRAVVIAGAK
jgi:hypothetical protein